MGSHSFIWIFPNAMQGLWQDSYNIQNSKPSLEGPKSWDFTANRLKEIEDCKGFSINELKPILKTFYYKAIQGRNVFTKFDSFEQ